MSGAPVRVTAIIIVLNGEAYLEEAVESVLGQQFEDWELLIVDDGSSDGTLDIARRFAAADGRIRILQHTDCRTHGMSQTRNLGLSQASGEYIAFLDADDVWLPHKLLEQVEILDSTREAAIVYGRSLIWHARNERKDFLYPLGVPPNELYRPPRLFVQLLENVHQTPTTCNAMIRRAIAIGVGGFDPQFPCMFEDQVFFAKLLALCPTYVSDRIWAKYRQHADSASARADPREVQNEHVRYLRVVRSFLVQRGKAFSGERLAVEGKLVSLLIAKRRDWIRASLRRIVRA